MKKCCSCCFSDAKAIDLISPNKSDLCGKCDICGAENVELYEIRPDSELSYQFGKLFDVFVPMSFEEPDRYLSEPKSLFDAFIDTWAVFAPTVSSSGFECFARELFPDDLRIAQMFQEKVVKVQPRCAEEDGPLFGGKTWDDFADEIKHEHRYMVSIEGKESLKKVFYALEKVISPDSKWYRGRIWNKSKEPPLESDLYEPPIDLTSEGRMSPRGVCCLYVADSPATAIFEIRAAMHDDVAIATLQPLYNLRIVDLSQIDEISPFLPEIDCGLLAINMDDLRRMKRDLIKPMRASDDPVEYVPTQYIADFVKSMGFDGIGYGSSMMKKEDECGYNIALFGSSKDLFLTREIRLYSIRDIEYRADISEG